MGDLAGNDVSWRIRQQVGFTTGKAADRKPNTRWDSGNPRYSSLADKLCEAGYYGQKAGRGWYKYDPKNPRKPIEDEETLALLKQHRQDVVSAGYCYNDSSSFYLSSYVFEIDFVTTLQ